MTRTGLNILRVMGCETTQYGSMERYLVKFTHDATRRGHRAIIVYERAPRVASFQKDIENAGGKFISLQMRHSLDGGYFVRLHRVIKAHDINVVHTYFTPTCHFVMLYSWLIGIRRRFRTSANMPLTTHTRFRKITPWFKRQFSLRQRFYALFPKKIITLSESMRKEFLDLGIQPSKLITIHGGVDLDYFTTDNNGGRRRVRAELGLPESVRVVGTLTRLVPMKGLEYLVEAASLISDQHREVKLLIVGDGPLLPELKQRVAELNLSDIVVFPGHRNDARDVLAALDLFVLPSFSEGMSNSLLEAMATGLPVVATSIPPNEELIRHRENGLLVPPRDSKALADAVTILLQDEQTAKRMGQHGRAFVEREYSVEKRVNAELDLYESTS